MMLRRKRTRKIRRYMKNFAWSSLETYWRQKNIHDSFPGMSKVEKADYAILFMNEEFNINRLLEYYVFSWPSCFYTMMKDSFRKNTGESILYFNNQNYALFTRRAKTREDIENIYHKEFSLIEFRAIRTIRV